MKKKIHVQWLSDEHECELCGTDYAHGAIVSIDGEEVIELEPVAHCYDGTSYEPSDVYKAIIDHLGYELVEKEAE